MSEPRPTTDLLVANDGPPTTTPDVYGISTRLDALTHELDLLDTATLLLKDVDDFDTLLVLHHRVDALRRKLTEVTGSFQVRAWACRGETYGDYHHPHLGVVSVRRTAKKERWAHDDLAQRVVDAHMADTDGEVPDPADVARWVMEAAAPSYWRKTQLKALGIDAAGEDLLTWERGNPTITFPSMK